MYLRRAAPNVAAVFSSAAALLMSLPVLAEDRTISWWYEAANPDQQRILEEEIIRPFEEANPGINVEVEFRGQNLEESARLALLAGEGPDIVYGSGPAYIAPVALAGYLEPLDKYAEQYGWRERILPAFLNVGTFGDRLFALPVSHEAMGLFYNPAVFEQHGWRLPTTIAEFEALADEMLAAGVVPLATGNASWRGSNEHYVTLMLNNVAGPDIYHKVLAGELPWTNPQFVAAIEKMAEWWGKGYFGPNYFSIGGEQAFAQLVTGETGVAPNGTWMFQFGKQFFEPAGAEMAFASFPTSESVPFPNYPIGVGATFSINKNSPNKDAVAKFLDYVYTQDFFERLNSVWLGQWVVPLQNLEDLELTGEATPAYAEAMEAMSAAIGESNYGYTTWTFNPPATNEYLITGIEDVWLNRATPLEYLTELDRLFQQELAEGKRPQLPKR